MLAPIVLHAAKLSAHFMACAPTLKQLQPPPPPNATAEADEHAASHRAARQY
jgi:hypothetical protein